MFWWVPRDSNVTATATSPTVALSDRKSGALASIAGLIGLQAGETVTLGKCRKSLGYSLSHVSTLLNKLRAKPLKFTFTTYTSGTYALKKCS
jgi:hypothetical protein